VSETKKDELLAGLTAEAMDGLESLPVMKDGEEPLDMLLALLNNALTSLVNSQQAKIMGRVMTKKGVGTLIIFYGALPTSDKTIGVIDE